MAAKSKESKSPRAYLLWGQEEHRKKEALATLLDQLVPPEDRDLDVEHLDATNPGITGDAILHAVRDRAMFSERRVVVVWNAGRLRGPRFQRAQEVLAAGIPTLPEYSTLILYAQADDSDERRGKAPFGEKLMAALRSAGKVTQFAPLKPEELMQVVTAEAAATGHKLPPAAARMLVERAGPDSNQVLQEIRKLAAYAGDRDTITPADVEEMVAGRPDDNVFHLLDATMAGDRKKALALIADLRASGTAVPQILVLMGRTLRQVAQAKYLQERRVNPKAEQEQVSPEVLAALPEENSLYGGNKGWLRGRLWEQSRRLTWAQLHQALDRLAVADAGTKGWEYGVEDPDLALEIYVTSLCDMVKSPTAGGEPRRASGGYAPRR